MGLYRRKGSKKELVEIVTRVQNGEWEAYEQIVQRFQDMAVGYSYAILGDLAAAEDVAQEALSGGWR